MTSLFGYESVSNDGCTRKHGLNYTTEKRRQVHHDEFHLHAFFTWKTAKIMNHFHAIPIRQDIQYFVSLRVIDCYLIPLSSWHFLETHRGIGFPEDILGLECELVKIPNDRGYRNTLHPGNGLKAYQFSGLLDFPYDFVRATLVTSESGNRLVKSLMAAAAEISSFMNEAKIGREFPMP